MLFERRLVKLTLKLIIRLESVRFVIKTFSLLTDDSVFHSKSAIIFATTLLLKLSGAN